MESSARVFAVAGAKGGVGKTTTAINLGAILAAADHAVAVVELDLAMANFVDFLDLAVDVGSDPTFHDVLAGEASLADATYEGTNGLAVVPSGTSLEGYAESDLGNLEGAVAELRETYDVVIFDTPAGLSDASVGPIRYADEVVLVSTPRVSSIRNVESTKQFTDRVGTTVRGLVLTKSGTGASPSADRIADFLDLELLDHVPEDDVIPQAQDQGQPVVEYAPRSVAAIAYRKIADKLLNGDGATPEAPARSADDGRDGPPADRRRMAAPTGGGTVTAPPRQEEAADERSTSPKPWDSDLSTEAWAGETGAEPATVGGGHPPAPDGDGSTEADEEGSLRGSVRALLGL